MFSLFPLFEHNDLPDVLRSIAGMSIDGVQFCNDLCGHSVREIRNLMDELGLEPISDHNHYAAIDTAYLDKVCELGVKSVFSSAFGPNDDETLDDTLRIAEQMNRAGELCRQYGLTFGVHNHMGEFIHRFGDRCKHAFLMDATDPETVKMELDVGWAVAGGCDPVAYIHQWEGRVAMLHIKECTSLPPADVTAQENRARLETCRKLGISLEQEDGFGFPSDYRTLSRILRKDSPIMAWNGKLGEGMIDWPEVVAAAEAQGCMGYISEREYNYVDDTVRCVREDCDYLKRILQREKA